MTRSPRTTSSVLLASVLGLAACAARSEAAQLGTLVLESPAFAAMATIPARYTCEGVDVSPPLRWSGVPEGTQSLVLIVDDPDAPDPARPKRTWVHWLLYNIPPTAKGLPDGSERRGVAAGRVAGP